MMLGREVVKGFVVLKASGSRYAYVNDTQEGKTIARYDILRGDGWTHAHKYADRLNARILPTTDTQRQGVA
jgi:hypothetical protein